MIAFPRVGWKGVSLRLDRESELIEAAAPSSPAALPVAAAPPPSSPAPAPAPSASASASSSSSAGGSFHLAVTRGGYTWRLHGGYTWRLHVTVTWRLHVAGGSFHRKEPPSKSCPWVLRYSTHE